MDAYNKKLICAIIQNGDHDKINYHWDYFNSKYGGVAEELEHTFRNAIYMHDSDDYFLTIKYTLTANFVIFDNEHEDTKISEPSYTELMWHHPDGELDCLGVEEIERTVTVALNLDIL